MRKQDYVCNLGFAKLDFGRKKRRGVPEVVFSPGKSEEYLVGIAREFIRRRHDLIMTRLEESTYRALKDKIPLLRYEPRARIGYWRARRKAPKKGLVAVACAGTSDIPVAEEAAVTLDLLGDKVSRLYDVGVAGVHRLMNNIALLRRAKVIIVVAGMEGALASLVSGLVSVPVVAVPTSCGYGANFEGLSALLTMLNSCSPGISVVNIDNGFGAGYLAHLINK